VSIFSQQIVGSLKSSEATWQTWDCGLSLIFQRTTLTILTHCVTNTAPGKVSPVSKLADTNIFNNSETFVEGWYWALPSSELKAKPVGIELLGKHLVVYRGKSGKPYALDAYCPHMGAHFKEGKVDGEAIRCGFHDWKFSEKGKCINIPCQKYADKTDIVPPVSAHPIAEKYGLIWIHSSGDPEKAAQDPLPQFSELGPDAEMEVLVRERTFRPCRPEIVMLNAIDAHHFNSVHPAASKLTGGMDLRARRLSRQAIRLENHSPAPTNWIGRLVKPFYKKDVLTYFLDYWYASTGVVTLGPDFLHLYLMFPHRPTLKGGTEGIMLFATRKRKGPLGRLLGRLIVWVTYIAGNYFEKGDRQIFESIQFSMRAPVKADHPIIEFIRHTEEQPARKLPWRNQETDSATRELGLRRVLSRKAEHEKEEVV
jgi:phenylpropionate dioxygenase-like ring-hydroxylating dioxygenase large terminal subunit